MLHITYSKISPYFYWGYLFITITIPLVWMVVAKILLGFLLLIHNNQELIKTTKNILQIFPEGIIIQTWGHTEDKLLVDFVNNTASKELLNENNPQNGQTDRNKIKDILNLVVKMKKEQSNSDQSEQRNTILLSELLMQHTKRIKDSTVVSTPIEIWNNYEEESKDVINSRYLNVKTIKVVWENSKNSFIHVFINTTALKQFEMERARNECLQLMFSSVSHEFRTPLNAFTNSVVMFESNYNQILNNI